MEKLNLTAIPNSDGEIIIRTGSALPVEPERNESFNTILKGPAIFYHNKSKNYVWTRAHLLVDRKNYKLTLNTGEHESHGVATVTGKLNPNGELGAFKINTMKTWTAKELSDFLKMRRFFFTDREENMKIVQSLNDIKLRVVKEIESSNDFKGQKKHHFEQSVQHEFKLSFTLNIPIFYGTDPSTFKVDINLDVTDAGVQFWLESVELKELEQDMVDRLIDTELSKFGDDICILEV